MKTLSPIEEKIANEIIDLLKPVYGGDINIICKKDIHVKIKIDGNPFFFLFKLVETIDKKRKILIFEDIFVEPRYRRQGLFSQIVDTLIYYQEIDIIIAVSVCTKRSKKMLEKKGFKWIPPNSEWYTYFNENVNDGCEDFEANYGSFIFEKPQE